MEYKRPPTPKKVVAIHKKYDALYYKESLRHEKALNDISDRRVSAIMVEHKKREAKGRK